MKKWEQVAIIGVGLLGGSIGLAMRNRGLAQRVVGIGRRATSLDAALASGAVDSVTTDLADGVRDAQLVIVCTPVDLIVQQVRAVAENAARKPLITDVGSTKSSIVERLEKLPNGAVFVGSHPMAGSEKTGVAFADSELFESRTVVISPTAQTQQQALEELTRFWQSLGANVVNMPAAEHDEAVAAVSHLPHIVASVLAAATPPQQLGLAATGWADTTRIASGDPELWRQILTQNRRQVLQAIDNFDHVLASFRSGLEDQDDSVIMRLLEAGKRNRDTVGS